MNDQYIIPLFVACSLLLTMFGFFLIAYLLVQKRKQNKYQLEKQKMIFDHQNNILRTKIEEQENTLSQLSRELHDNQNNTLGIARMNMTRMTKTTITDEQSILLNGANELISKVIEELRNISHSLNSSFVKSFGLVDTITKELGKFQLSKDISYHIEIKGTPVPLKRGTDTELHIYRIAQEAIQNSIKHAKAKNLNFTFEYEPGLFIMKITDDGVGFDKKKIHEMKGLRVPKHVSAGKVYARFAGSGFCSNEGKCRCLSLKIKEDKWIL